MSENTSPNLPPPNFYKKERFNVDKENPWKNDKLEREKVANKLQSVLEPVTQPVVITISSTYGTGKTTFIECWRQQLENQGAKTVLFNAWESDYSTDAFGSFVACLESQLSEKSEIKKKIFDQAGKIGGAIVRNAPMFLAKVVTKNLIGEGGVKALEDFDLNEEDAVKLAEGLAIESFQAQKDLSIAVEEFRNGFASIVENNCNSRLYVFVDELDRCKPAYAVEVLERIKHVFSVRGVIFVLAVDKDQLLNSFRGVYGANLDADGYLARFIDWQYFLPPPDNYKYIRHLSDNIFDFVGSGHMYRGEDNANGVVYFNKFFTLITEAYNLSLRDTGRCMTYVNLVLRESGQTNFSTPLAIAAAMKFVDRQLYDALKVWYHGNSNEAISECSALVQRLLSIKPSFFKNTLGYSPSRKLLVILAFFCRNDHFDEDVYLPFDLAELRQLKYGGKDIDVDLLLSYLKNGNFSFFDGMAEIGNIGI